MFNLLFNKAMSKPISRFFGSFPLQVRDLSICCDTDITIHIGILLCLFNVLQALMHQLQSLPEDRNLHGSLKSLIALILTLRERFFGDTLSVLDATGK